jgi:hypothetical protein
MGTPVEGPPSLEGQGGPPQQYMAYDPRGNGLARQPTYPQDPQPTQNLSPRKPSDPPKRQLTDPDLSDPPKEGAPKPKGRSKTCGKCGEGLTGQFVRALGDTYHLECFTCHVRRFDMHKQMASVILTSFCRIAARSLPPSFSLSPRSLPGNIRCAKPIISAA